LLQLFELRRRKISGDKAVLEKVKSHGTKNMGGEEAARCRVLH